MLSATRLLLRLPAPTSVPLRSLSAQATNSSQVVIAPPSNPQTLTPLFSALANLVAKNSRRVKKANHGARPNSNEGRRRKRRGFGKWKR